ncbi:ribose 5-phosphate isomerase A [Clostridium fungisolvens]|uniref:Ribose 5-phosphate isomerase A n=1 Tax=Clostridium fungisolvens TaxID=1604897 RepID=A0A6V8SBU9_9CLOT|nr:ribose 5-phosphate isomerase A [Clostridium fungisolvens]GFP74697.1 Ribose-5-phosphate isomerase A [Clostridium fungisolvens]
MNEENLRKLSAEKAMEYIKNNSVIGLGAGRTISCLIELLSKAIDENNLKIKAVTPSDNTKSMCIKNGIEVLPTCFVEEVDVAFDGCGEVDENFYASKGGGGVFVKEKLIASMAKDYVLLIDEQKYKKQLSVIYPISLEVVKDSLSYVSKVVKNLGGEPLVRTTNSKDGYLVTDDNNFILDIKFDIVDDFKELNDKLNNIVGVVGTSIFTREVTKLIMATENGVRVISKN